MKPGSDYRLSHVLTAMLVILLALIVFPSVCLAYESPDPDRTGSITMVMKTSDKDNIVVEGAVVELIRIADMTSDGGNIKYRQVTEFSGSGIDVNNKIDRNAVAKLAEYIESNNITGLSYTSDKDGKISATGLKAGIYMAVQNHSPDGFTSFEPFIIYLPYLENGSWVYDVTAEPKIKYIPPVKITVRKIWNDDGSKRPSSITVQLKNEDGVFEEVVLNGSNNWSYEWDNMDPSKTWNVIEINVPKGYTVSYSNSGFSFKIKNTSKLIQTGQLDWPVPVMLFAGLFLLSAGIIINVNVKNKKANADKKTG